MTFVYDALRDRPVCLFPLDDSSPFKDLSGYGSTLSMSGTSQKHSGIVTGTKGSQVVSAQNIVTFPSRIMTPGTERQSFSIEAWARVISSDEEQQVLGRASMMDGLIIESNKAKFRVKFANAPVAEVVFDYQQEKTLHLVGVKSAEKIALYVNGSLAAGLNLTEEQKKSPYQSSSEVSSSGDTAGTQRLAVSCLAIYFSELSPEAIIRHHSNGAGKRLASDVAKSFDGESVPISLAGADLILDQWWTTEEEWKTGISQNLAVVNGQLVPQFEQGVSIYGTWMNTVPIDSLDVPSIHGVSMNWDGLGVNVEASLDGENWEVVERGRNIGLIPEGFNPLDKQLEIRISFPGGILDDESYLDNLNAVVIRSASAPTSGQRSFNITNGYQERDYNSLLLHQNWGVELVLGGILEIEPDITEPVQLTRTIELWIKKTTSTNPVFSVNGTFYKNGITSGIPFVLDQWALVHLVLDADTNNAISITGPAQVGHVALYDYALTSSQILDNYYQHLGAFANSLVDSSPIIISESATPVKLYAHDWSIQTSG